MPKKYQIYKDIAGKYRFRLIAENGRIVAVSEAYEQYAGCVNGVKSVQNNCVAHVEDTTVEAPKLSHPKYKVFTDEKGRYRFHLTAANGEIIAQSEGYNSKDGCLNGIEVMNGSCDAEVEDLVAAHAAKAVPGVAAPVPPVMEAAVEAEKMAPQATQAPAEMVTCLGPCETKLELDSLPEVVKKGDVMTFRGRLAQSGTNEGIPRSRISILELDRSFVNNELLAEGVTEDDGSFSIAWKARGVDWWDDTGEFYAEFEGNEKARPSRTEPQTVHIE